ncbi:uncharacterized protein LOC129596115 [Paramacrobiotus metropolitanus]|uniref:uncharacterized protein LOC129596115 n=1 Tax=Paramacrobiotus metropolitanus TaxID=2943436 RepID=UPI002445C518|nr:uncharacterized protein LOC129596115 [Paramacrobiotus metropolitanus]XP_055349276.1 uncharacterized protein LOC129596115 [Paramacrobiotus metropolitanus]
MLHLSLLVLLIKSATGQWITKPGDPDTAPYFPHPLCHYSDAYQLTCSHADLHIPQNFRTSALYSNTSRIYNDVMDLVLDCPTSINRTYCNTVGPNATALSSNYWIWYVTLIGFQAEGGGRAPIDVLLAELRGLSRLRVHYSKIGTLDRHFFRHFKDLTRLDIRNNDIRVIELDAFDPFLRLFELKMGGNALQTLDWSVLRPVSTKLNTLEVDAQTPPLHTLRRSGSLFSINITTLSLNQSHLSSLPKDVVDTFDVRQYGNVLVDIGNSPVCPDNADCSCCAMKDLADWFANRTAWAAGGIGQLKTETRKLTVKVTCGSRKNAETGNAVKEFSLTNPLLPSMYANCQ